MAVSYPVFEQGPIRPPSEASSLLVRLTRNCPWNRCLFCPVYKNEAFSKRSPEEIKKDIRAMEDAVNRVKEISIANGYQGEINSHVATLVRSEYPELFQVALWLYHGAETVFLQDADSLLLPVSQVSEILGMLKEKLPSIKRVTTYARSRTLLRRSVSELVQLKDAGLNRIHVGLESGNDTVLKFMQKGVTAAQHLEAGIRVKEAGISLSEYVILGLGGLDLWKEHALDTAGVLNKINPDYIRVRTLAVPAASPLRLKIEQGEFEMLTDEGVVREEALFIENLEGIDSTFYSDHVLNLLEEVCGKLPGDKPVMLDTIKRYLAMPEAERELFCLGRRTGYFRYLEELNNKEFRQPVENIYSQLQKEGVTVDDFIKKLMLRFI